MFHVSNIFTLHYNTNAKHYYIPLPLVSDSHCWHHSSLLQVLPFGLTGSAVEQEAPNMKFTNFFKN